MFYQKLNEILQQRYAETDARRERLYLAAHALADAFAARIHAPQTAAMGEAVLTRNHVFAAVVGGTEPLPKPEVGVDRPEYNDDRLNFDIVVKIDKPSAWRNAMAIAVTVQVQESLDEMRYKIVNEKGGDHWKDTSNERIVMEQLEGEFEYLAKNAV